MTQLFEQMGSQIGVGLTLAFFLRVLVASLCGLVIGFERSRRYKEAGIRTHTVVACTAALLMILSKYGFADLAGATAGLFGADAADPARIAAQIISGVGFLGVGVIFRNGSSIKGLTTAAGIWATAAVGMAVGSGMYFLGLFVTLMIVAVQAITHKVSAISDNYASHELIITAENNSDFRTVIQQKLTGWRAQIIESDIEKKDTVTAYHLIVRMPRNIPFDEVLSFIEENAAVKTFTCHTVN